MAFTAVASWGSATEPFQLAGKNPLLHQPGSSSHHNDLWHYADGHLGFYGFLRVVDTRISRRVIVGLLDLPDRCWRDAYDERVHPGEAADEAIAETAEEMGIAEP